MNTINERFTNIADKVSLGMGYWWVSAIALVLVLVWLIAGPLMHFSDTWQLLVNTPTTVIELFIGFLLAAAANRQQRHNDEMLAKQDEMLTLLISYQDQELEELHKAGKILEEEDKILTNTEDIRESL